MKQQPAPVTLTMQKEPDEVIGLIQGKVPDSINEWYVSRALDKLQVEYIYQYSIYGGTSLRGGIVVDFVVYNPKAQPVEIQGGYWHSERMAPEDRLSFAAEQQYFGNYPILLKEEETDSLQNALSICKKKIL